MSISNDSFDFGKSCEKHGFEVYLGCVSREVHGGCDDYGDDDDDYGYGYGYGRYERDKAQDGFHEICEIYEDESKLTRVVDQSGLEITTDIVLDESNVLQEKSTPRGTPNSEDYEDYTGNERTTATHFYRDAVSPYYSPTALLQKLFTVKISDFPAAALSVCSY